jgi:hypothetical protein
MPHLLTADHYDLLPAEAQTRADLEILVERAEMRWIDRYREVRPSRVVESLDTYDYDRLPSDKDVQLAGWAEVTQEQIDAGTNPDGTELGDPNINTMDSDLLRRLRLAIVMQVQIWIEEEDAEGIQSIRQGDRSVTYLDPDEHDPEAEIAAMLRPFDVREAWF